MNVSGRIPREFINELLVRVDIVDLIDSHLPLKKTGANYVARCPFHTEKSPSFSVSRNKQMFHCFGCGASGNAISFLMDFNHSDFVEAVEDLAAFVGVDVPRETASSSYQVEPKKQDLSQLYSVMEQVAAFYVQQLRSSVDGKKAVEYLKARGISGDCANDFMLGYAPTQWKSLLEQFDAKTLMDCGLLGSNDNGEFYGRFRGRLMFPIRDRRARIVGFGGRVLDDSLPKYLNSPETALFSKGKEVYGLYELLAKNSKPARILIVEGYMDVIALAQFGIPYSVAVLGTAASRVHLDLLFRFTSELVFCFDGDSAGQTAAWRVMESTFASLKDGKSCRIMLLPPQHDPDSLIREQGLSGFTECIETALPLSDYFFGHFTNVLNLSETEGRAQLVSQAKPYLEKLPESVFKEMMLERLKKLSGLATLEVLENTPTVSPKQNQQQRPEQGRPALQRRTLALLIQHPELVSIIEQREINWDCLKFEGVEKFTSILQVILHEKPANTGALLEYYRNHKDEPIIKRLESLQLEIPAGNEAAEFSGALDKLFAQSMDERSNLLLKLKTTGLTLQEKEQLRELFNTK
ncbi:MAG: DNA primase [Methylococcaceae bacterium]|nr:DNA primase [Methylococcaceae bacterium]